MSLLDVLFEVARCGRADGTIRHRALVRPYLPVDGIDMLLKVCRPVEPSLTTLKGALELRPCLFLGRWCLYEVTWTCAGRGILHLQTEGRERLNSWS